MTREVLFRARRKNNGEWAEGSLILTAAEAFIVTSEIEDWTDLIPVKRSTVGQFTGLLDKNGKKIFEGDVCTCGTELGGKPLKWIIVWYKRWWGYRNILSRNEYASTSGYMWKRLEVISTIHDTSNQK